MLKQIAGNAVPILFQFNEVIKMKYLMLISFFVFSFWNSQLFAQATTECSTNPLENLFVEARALDAWEKCDMRCSGQPGPHHILLVGDSVGALLAASPEPFATIVNGIKSKSWDYFLTNPAPQGMTNWRVLNTAISGAASFAIRPKVEKCLGDPTNDKAKLFQETAPGRVWMEIGGNDIKYAKLISINPHWAHYVNNATLNNVGKMVSLFQKNGRTVLLMGYHSMKADNVTKADRTVGKDLNLLNGICGIGKGEGTAKEVLEILFDDGICVLANGIRQIVTGVARVFFDNINKLRLWMQNQLGPLGSILTGDFSKLPGAGIFYSGMRQIDLSLGRALGMNQSFTGLFEDPAARFRGRHGHRMDNYLDQFKGGIGGQQFWDFLQTTPRYEEGWAVQFAGANQVKALSAVITIYGRRLKESYWAQGVPIPGTNRRTVEYVSAEAEFKDPLIEWASRNELMADDVHPSDAGYSVYAPVIARKLKSLQYDTVPSDYDFTQKEWRDWTPLAESPVGEDLIWLFLCFFYHFCR